MPGLPHFMRLADVAATYESASGHAPRELEWYVMYGALRHAIVMFRIGRRSVHFGEAEMPADTDDLVMHRAMLEAMLDGSYWSRI
jgi:aminoglycoside phosphotransferase (APT) family kinase protein